MDELGGREAVVELDQIEVLRTDAGCLVGLSGSVTGQRVDVGLHLAALHPWIAGQHRGRDLHGPLLNFGRQRT